MQLHACFELKVTWISMQLSFVCLILILILFEVSSTINSHAISSAGCVNPRWSQNQKYRGDRMGRDVTVALDLNRKASGRYVFFVDAQMALVLQVKLLLTHHADPTICNKELKTPLDLACEFGRYRVRKTSLPFALVLTSAWSQSVRGSPASQKQKLSLKQLHCHN